VLTQFNNGRFSGTDIKPQWRLQAMTEQFGPIGIGWYYEKIGHWIEKIASGEICAFVEINMFIKEGDNWSKPIFGTGGSMLVASEKKGLHTSDEAFKMATTDALSVAMKQLGVGADIYMGQKGVTKYSNKPTENNNKCTPPQVGMLKAKCTSTGKQAIVLEELEKQFKVKKFEDVLFSNVGAVIEMIEGCK
jgi:hypothetical protein